MHKPSLAFALLALVAPASIARAQTIGPPPRPAAPPPPPPIEVLEQRQATHPTAGNAFLLGQAYLKANRPAEAMTAFQASLKGPGNIADHRLAAERAISKLKEVLASLDVFCTEAGAVVFVDGRSLGEVVPGRIIYLLPGEHEVRVEKAGKMPHKEVIAPGPGVAVQVEATLPLAVGAPLPPGPAGPPAAAPLVVAATAPAASPGEKPGGRAHRHFWLWAGLGVLVAAAAGGTLLVLRP